MAGLTYNQLMNDGFRRYKAGRYSEAYELVTELAPTLPGNLPQIYNFRFCLASIAGRHELALRIMHDAIIEKGFWYSKEFLDDSDLDSIRETEEFKTLAAICAQREEAAKKNSFPKSMIFESPTGDSTLIALHGNAQNISLSKRDWDSCLKKGCNLALLQSSQISFSDGFYWNDYEKGANELEDFWNGLQHERNFGNGLIGGFSAGARVALYSVLTKRIRPKAFILIGPWIPEIGKWKNLVEELDRSIKGLIICGDQDEDCYQLAKASSNLLNSGGISTELQIIPGLDHDFPLAFNQILAEIIESVRTSGAE